MKRLGVFVVLGACLGGLCGATWGLSPCDYRSPVTAMTEARLSLTYRYFNDAATPVIDVNSGRVAMNYDQLLDSPSYGFTIAGAAELTLNAFRPTGWLGQAAATFRWYPIKEALLFGFGGLEASMATGQPLPRVDVRVGLGVGRFTDVTPLAKAMVIEEKLLALEAIFDRLSDEAVLGIAALIGREAEYASLKGVVAEIENLIETVARVELGARALLSIEEIILMTGIERKCGWAIQGGIGYELIDPFGGAQNVVVTASADWAFATGPDDQLLFHAGFSGPFDLIDEHILTVTFGYEYELSEDVSLDADYALQRVKPSGLAANTSHAASLALDFDIGGADLGLRVALTREAGDPGWSIDVSVSAAMDLL
jgi:hypothetical protein